MDQHFLDVLKRHAASLLGRPDQISADLEAACLRLADALGAVEPSVRQELLALVQPRILALLGRKDSPEALATTEPTPSSDATGGQEGRNGVPLPEQFVGPQPMKLPPELLEWYRQNTNMEEAITELREVERTGGLELKDFLPQLEKEFGLND